jgi:signal transduction histidine kinase/CheY-like chemotaxis protein
MEAAMVRAIWSHLPVDEDNRVNLEDLRSQLTTRLAILLMGIAGFGAWWLTLRHGPLLFVPFLLFLALFSWGMGVQLCLKDYPTFARHLLVWGLTLGLLLSFHLFADPWLPFLGLILILMNAMLVSGSELVTAAAIAFLAGRLTQNGDRNYPLQSLFPMLTLGLAVTWLAVHTLYTALQWMRSMQQRTDQLLAEVREHRAELSRTLKASDLANTLLRRTQRELIIARKGAEVARHLKEQFAVNISHELRTPLNLILGFSEVMYLSPEVYGPVHWPPILRRDVHHIYQASRHLLEMIDDVLDLSRFEMTGFTLNKELTPLEPLLRDTMTIAADLFRGSPVRLEIQLTPNLPALELDRTRIRQVLLNLLNNAQRFTSEGRVLLTAKLAKGEVIISVSDTGPGIPAEKLAYIFDEFYQVDLSLRRSYQGAGLGLAISKRFVEAHGGYIWAESQVGLGSTFFFSLPISSHYLPAPPGKVTDLPEPQWAEKSARILVIDPDPAFSTLIHRHLEKYEIIQLHDLAHLAEALDTHHPRAVIHNISPGTPPHEILPAIPVPFIECSLPSQAWLANELAVAACLSKPITAQQLLPEIDRLGSIEKILIIDDDRGFGQLVERMLMATGRSFKITYTYEGQEGFLAMQSHRPDLVLLDLMMPGVDGFQVLKQIQKDEGLATVPVILLTATSYAEDALVQSQNQLLIRRTDGLRPVEILACLQAVIDILKPRYDERTLPEEINGTPMAAIWQNSLDKPEPEMLS